MTDGSKMSGCSAVTEIRRSIHVLDVEASRSVDAAAIERYGLSGLVLMENAARGVVSLLRSRYPGATRALVVCGSGNNGGDGYAIARMLVIRGWSVTILALSPPREGSDASVNASIASLMQIPTCTVEEFGVCAGSSDVVIDALFGTGLDRDVTGEPAHVIAMMDEVSCPIVSVDIPSGLDAQYGRPLGVAVSADCTVTFVGPKPGLLTAASRASVGALFVADIGAPMDLVAEFGLRTVSSSCDTGGDPQIEWVDS